MKNNSKLYVNDISSGKIVFFAWDPTSNRQVLAVSPSLTPNFGYQPEDFYQRKLHYADLIHPDDMEKVKMEVEFATRKGKSEFTHEIYRIKDANGRYRSVYDHTKILRNDQGDVIEYQGFISDETDILEQKTRLELVLTGTQLGMWDWYPQTNKVIFDEPWANMLGYQLAEIDANLETWESKVHPDDIGDCYMDIQSHMEGRTPYYQNVHRMMHKDGQWRYILDRGQIVERDIDGNPIRFTGSHTDITELKQIQEKLEAEQQKTQSLLKDARELSTRYKNFLALSTEAILLFIAETGQLIEYSELAQTYLGYDDTEMKQLNITDIDRDTSIADFREFVSAYQNETKQFNCVHTRKDGSEYQASVRARLIPSQDTQLVIASVRDITEALATNHNLKTYQHIVQGALNGVMICDAQNKIIEVNQAFEKISGYSQQELLGCHPNIHKSHHQETGFYKTLWQEVSVNGYWKGKITNRRKDGYLYTCIVNITTVKDDNDAILKYVAIYSDITEMVESEAELNYIASHDSLTHLSNRKVFLSEFEHAIGRAKRNQKHLALLFFDLDKFKPVNDTHGHLMGDKLLQQVADRLIAVTRSGDVLARYAGDEFVMLSEDIDGAKNAAEIAQKIRHQFDGPFQINDLSLTIHASIGIALYPQDGTDTQTLIEAADQAMYQEKHAKSNA